MKIVFSSAPPENSQTLTVKIDKIVPLITVY